MVDQCKEAKLEQTAEKCPEKCGANACRRPPTKEVAERSGLKLGQYIVGTSCCASCAVAVVDVKLKEGDDCDLVRVQEDR
eukprot:scaffold21574_cov158-Skeletonema_dohrnii-CCMP3373.AAC.2